MIVVSVEKELVQVASWEDIQSRPGFNPNLDPAKHELKGVIGNYQFAEPIPCGLSNCHTPHNKGFIATTKDGQETNVGNVCGKKYFGIDFEAAANAFEEEVKDKLNRDTINSFQIGLDAFNARVADLLTQPQGASWAYKKLQAFQDGRCGNEVARRLREMRRTGRAEVMRDVEATESEIEALEAAAGGRRLQRPHYLQIPVSTLAGVEALYEENDLRNLLVFDLQQNAKDLAGLDAALMTRRDLRHHAKWVSTTSATFNKATAALASARRFLTMENLEPFAQCLTSDAAAIYRKFLADLLEVKVSGKC